MSNSYEAVGTLHFLTETQQVKDTFRKREFVLEIQDGNYPQHIKFQVTQDRCAILDSYKVGQQLKVMFNLRGRPFQNKDGQTLYFTNLEAWRVEAAGAPAPTTTDYSQISAANPGAKDDFDDVPF
jgi:single-strand DNA-binding protein